MNSVRSMNVSNRSSGIRCKVSMPKYRVFEATVNSLRSCFKRSETANPACRLILTICADSGGRRGRVRRRGTEVYRSWPGCTVHRRYIKRPGAALPVFLPSTRTRPPSPSRRSYLPRTRRHLRPIVPVRMLAAAPAMQMDLALALKMYSPVQEPRSTAASAV